MNKISYIENKAKLVDPNRSAELLRQIEQPLFLLDEAQQVDLVKALPEGASPSGMLPAVPLMALAPLVEQVPGIPGRGALVGAIRATTALTSVLRRLPFGRRDG